MGTPVPLDLLPENLRPRGTPVPLDLLPKNLRPQAAPQAQAQAAPTQDDYKQQAIAQRGKERGFFGGVYDAVMGNELEAPEAYTPAELAARQKEIAVEQKKLAREENTGSSERNCYHHQNGAETPGSTDWSGNS